jgi:hypothetical protein
VVQLVWYVLCTVRVMGTIELAARETAAALPRHQPAGKTARLVLMWYSLFGTCCALSG